MDQQHLLNLQYVMYHDHHQIFLFVEIVHVNLFYHYLMHLLRMIVVDEVQMVDFLDVFVQD
jgi:hypothetical protein